MFTWQSVQGDLMLGINDHQDEHYQSRAQGYCLTSVSRVATAQGKQGIWFLLFPDRENTGNFALAQGEILRHRENIFL